MGCIDRHVIRYAEPAFLAPWPAAPALAGAAGERRLVRGGKFRIFYDCVLRVIQLAASEDCAARSLTFPTSTSEKYPKANLPCSIDCTKKTGHSALNIVG